MVSYENNGNKFNFRVNGIIYNKDKTQILIHQIKGYDFWLLPGGRVELLEDTKTAVVRELKEELEIHFEVQNLLAVNETFFNFSNKKYHEIGFFYTVKPAEKDHNKFKIMCQQTKFAGVEGEKYIFKWIDLKDLKNINFKPSCIIDNILNCHTQEFHHYVINEL